MSGPGRPRLSVVMITLNEERLLERALRSVAWADEIVIVDSGSTDRTEEIAARYTAHFHRRPYEGHGIQRRRSLELSSGEWILYIDADEEVTPALRQSIERALASPGDSAGYRMELHTFFLGQRFGSRGWRREWKLRLFRRDAGRFDDAPIHEGASVEGPIGTLDGLLLHHPYRDIEHFADKMNRYSTAMALRLREGGRRSSPAGAVLSGGMRFLRDYVAGGDFLYGAPGVVRSAMYGYYAFLKHIKLWSLARTADAPPGSQRPEHDREVSRG